MDDWALSNDDRPPPRWLLMSLTAAAGIALMSLLVMGSWIAALYLVPRNWLP